MAQTLKKVQTKHQLMMYDLVFNRQSTKEVADKHGLTVQRLNLLRRSPIWIKEEDKLKKEVLNEYKDELSKTIPEALATLKEVVGSTYKVEGDDGVEKTVTVPPATRVQAASQILDRTGMKDSDQGQTGGVTIQLYAPGYANPSGKGGIIDVEMETKKDA